MSRITNREVRRKPAPVEQRLARLPDSPLLARIVPHLPPETLHQLVRSHGLEACSELVTSATPAQLTSLLDLDLWRNVHAGRNDQFDVDRFGEWLEVLVDAGSSLAARTVAALDKQLVIVGLSRYIRVLDPGIFEPVAQSDDEPIGRDEAMREGDSIHASEYPSIDGLACEVAGYIVRARRADAWDAIVQLMVALEAEHGHYFHAVMQACRGLSNSRPEIDGLDDLLLAPEQHLYDAAIERERRRSHQGYATPADARAFLEMARRPGRAQSAEPLAGSIAVNPIVSAYFREVEEAPTRAHAAEAGIPESLEAVMELLTEAGVMPDRPRALLDAGDAKQEDARLTCLRRLMACARDSDDAAYLTRGRELAFLANTLIAGCSVQSRPFTAPEASDAAAGICNLGLEYWSGGAATLPDAHLPDSWLIEHDLVSAFEVGWATLHRDVSVFVTEQLIAMLTGFRCADRDIRHGIAALKSALVKHRGAGTPWLARDAAEVLAMLDMTAWISVLGLLDECPVVPAALNAILEGGTKAVSPTTFDFISTATQIGAVRRFMQKLPAVLSH